MIHRRRYRPFSTASGTFPFLSLPERFAAGLPASASQEEILKQIEDAARVLSESTGFQPFSYVRDGQRRLPVFSNEDMAAEFAKWYALECHRTPKPGQ